MRCAKPVVFKVRATGGSQGALGGPRKLEGRLKKYIYIYTFNKDLS